MNLRGRGCFRKLSGMFHFGSQFERLIAALLSAVRQTAGNLLANPGLKCDPVGEFELKNRNDPG